MITTEKITKKPRKNARGMITTEMITTEKIVRKNYHGKITTGKITTVDYEQTKGRRYWHIQTNKAGGQHIQTNKAGGQHIQIKNEVLARSEK